jgi:EAL domain-containing protein (putative c-di-GMP-specific phosphodiesterase class I)
MRNIAHFGLSEIKRERRETLLVREQLTPTHGITGAYHVDMDVFSKVVNNVKVDVAFQPYFDTRDGQPKLGELLARPEVSTNPAEFFATLDIPAQAKLIELLVDCSNELAAQADTHSSINIHNSFIETAEGRGKLIEVLSGATNPLTVEFTETFPMPPIDVSNLFGTGLSGMSLLVDYDFNSVKIDRVLTVDVENSEKKAKVLALIFEMLGVLSKSHVVEGVETKEVYETLAKLGYTTFQGFYFTKPIPIAEYIKENQAG